ncbi:MAG: tetratricopeptide repeat protein [Marinicella pacifica]
MPTPSHLKKEFKAQYVFTDREKPQQVFIDRFSKPQASDEYRILNYYGHGGIGKTALYDELSLTLTKIKQEQKTLLGWATLNFKTSRYRSSEEALLSLRLQLAEQCNISFPAFDTAFARYFSFVRKGCNIHETYPSLFKQTNDVLLDIESVVGDLIEEIPGVGLIYKYLHKLKTKTQKWWDRRGKDVLCDLDSLDEHKLVELLPKYLGADLCDWLSDKKTADKRRLVILMDTYEALWQNQPTKTGIESIRVDAWIKNLLEETPGILYVILGREKLNWEDYWGDDWDNCIETHLLEALSPQDADKFLQQVPIEEAAIRDVIVESSEGHPFYLNIQAHLYENFKNKKIDLKASRFGGKEDEILARFIDHLDEQTRLALKIVSHANFIDESLVLLLSEKFLGGSLIISFKKLTNYSFWRRENFKWSMHKLLRDYLQNFYLKEEPEAYEQIHGFLFEYYDNQLDSIQNVVEITEDHKLALNEASFHKQQFDLEQFPMWANKRGQIFYEAYAWNQVESLWLTALIIGERLLEKNAINLENDTFNVVSTLNNLALLYKSQAKYSNAKSLFERCLKLNVDDAFLATILNNLAMLHESLAEYSEAIPLLEESLKLSINLLGEEHPNVTSTQSNLAMIYSSIKDYDKAENLLKSSLSIVGNYQGKESWQLPTILNNLALVYHYQAKYNKALPLFKRSLEISEKKFGGGHIKIAKTLNNIAMVYDSQNNHAKAAQVYLRSLKISEKVLGKEHPDLVSILENLANLYKILENIDKAEGIYKRCLKIRKNTFGKNHISTTDSLHKLALFYHHQSVFASAEILYQDCLTTKIKLLGEEHFATSSLLFDFASMYRDQSEYVKAEALYQRCLKITIKLFGEEHSYVEKTLFELARLYFSQNEYSKAEPLYEKCLKIRLSLYGENHLDVADILTSYGSMYLTWRKFTKAEPLYVRCLVIRINLLGEEHLDVARSLFLLATVYMGQYRYIEAKQLFIGCLGIRVKLLGENHPDVINTVNMLSTIDAINEKSEKKNQGHSLDEDN